MIYSITVVLLCSASLVQGMDDVEAGSTKNLQQAYEQNKRFIKEEKYFMQGNPEYRDYRRNIADLDEFFPRPSKMPKSYNYWLTGARNFDQMMTRKDLDVLLDNYFNHSERIFNNEMVHTSEKENYIAKRQNILSCFQYRIKQYCKKDRTCAQDTVPVCEVVSGVGCDGVGTLACMNGYFLLGVSSVIASLACLFWCLPATVDTLEEWRQGKILIGNNDKIKEIYSSLKKCREKHAALLLE